MDMDLFRKPSELIRAIKFCLSHHEQQDFPITKTLHEGMEEPKFTITIEKEDVEYYTDSSGQKWKKVE